MCSTYKSCNTTIWHFPLFICKRKHCFNNLFDTFIQYHVKSVKLNGKTQNSVFWLPGKLKQGLGKRVSSLSHINPMKILIQKQLWDKIIGRRDILLSRIIWTGTYMWNLMASLMCCYSWSLIMRSVVATWS